MLKGELIVDLMWRLYFFKAHKISFGRTLGFLRKSQYWARETLQQYQVAELNKLLALARANSPFYREYYHKHKSVLQNPCDMAQFPFVTKDAIRTNADLMRSINVAHRSFEHVTSGSTGDPLVVHISPAAEAFRIAGKYRFYEWWNVRPHDRSILVWAKKATDSHGGNIASRIKRAIRANSIERRLFVNVFDLSSSSIREYYEKAVRYKPVYIYGYQSGVTQFAELLIDAGLDPSALNLKLVVVTSEVLQEETRQFLRNAFRCPVANEYGSAEAGLFAFDCPHGSMHIFEEGVFLSSLENGGMVVTEIHNSTMPLINYINNDMVTISDDLCGCGRTSRLITQVNGRASDHALTISGDKVSQYLFYYAVKELNDIGLSNAIRKYKVIQRGRTLDFFLIKGMRYDDRALAYLSERVKKALGYEMDVRFHFVDEIEREKSGKLRFFVQETPSHTGIER